MHRAGNMPGVIKQNVLIRFDDPDPVVREMFSPANQSPPALPDARIQLGRTEEKMGLTGLEPVTLRLSSACSNQLSYRPGSAAGAGFEIFDCRFSICFVARFARIYLNRQSQIANRK